MLFNIFFIPCNGTRTKQRKKNFVKKKGSKLTEIGVKMLRLMPFPYRSSSVAVDGRDRGPLLSSEGGGAEVGVVGGVTRFDRKFESFRG